MHRFGVAGGNDDEVVTPVLHLAHEDVDGLLSVVSVVTGERVSLVDEEHTAGRSIEGLSRPLFGFA